MAIALIAWLSAPAPTVCISTAPCSRTIPASAPATEFGFDLLETLRTSTVPPWMLYGPPHGGCCVYWLRLMLLVVLSEVRNEYTASVSG